jgi:hypothetical protein
VTSRTTPIRPGWEHVIEDTSHPADVRYPSGGVVPSTGKPVVGNKFVCFTCRELVHFTGVADAAAAVPPRDGPPGGLESDGS